MAGDKTLAEVAVEVRADMRRLKPEVVRGAQQAGADGGAALGDGIVRGADGRLRNAQGKFVASGASSAKSFSKGFASGIDGTFAKVAATMAARFALIGGAAAAAAPGILQFTAALAPAAGAVAVLPVGLLALKAATGVVRIAVMGVGDAISAGLGDDPKKAAKALEGLTGNARAFAKQVIGMRQPLLDIKTTISDRFFLPMIDDVRPLAGQFLPMLRSELGDLAGRLGGVGEQLLKSAKQGIVFEAVRSLLRNTTNAALELRGAIDPVVEGFANLIKATSGELPKLAYGISNVAGIFGVWLTEVSQSGRVVEAFNNAKVVLRDLAAIIGNVGSIISTVFRAAGENGNSLLGTLRDVTGQAAAFFRTAQAGGALTAVFATLGEFGAALRTSLGAVLPAIAQSLILLGPALAAIAGPAAQIVVALAPLLPLVAGIAAVILTKLTPAISALAGWLAQNETAVKTLAGALVAYVAILKISAAVAAVQAAGGMLAWVKATTIASNVTKVFTALQYALGVAMKFALGPIGLIITGIAALVAGVIYAWKNHEGFRTAVLAVWDGIKKATSAVVDWFTGTALPWMQRVWKGIADGAVSMWENYIKPAVQALVGFWQNVLAPAAMWLWKNVITPVFNTIARVVKAAFAVVELAAAVVVAYFRNVLAPAYTWLWKNIVVPAFNGISSVVRTVVAYMRGVLAGMVAFFRNVIAPTVTWLWKNIVVPAFNGWKTTISTVWGIIKPILQALINFIQQRVVKSFQTSVSAISKAWNGLREAARKPIAFVVNSVINPLIGGFNKVAGVFGTSKIDPIGGFAKGGRIPGPSSNGRDNMLATIFNQGKAAGMIRIGTGEFVVNTDSTDANEPVLNAINRKHGKVTHDDIDPYLDGYAKGGRVGRGMGDGIGDIWNKIKGGISGAAEFITNPGKALGDVANAALNRIPGAGALVDVLKGMGKRVIADMVKWIKGAGGGALGGAGGAESWQAKRAIIAGWFPNMSMISGFRPGSRTLSGRQSLHARGLAVDYPPSRALAARIHSTFGRNTQELITPFQEFNLLHGRPHRYTGAVWNQHNFAGGNAHVHWGAQDGGKIGPRSGISQIARADFGSVSLARGQNLIYNGLGRTEKLVDPASSAGAGIGRLHPADIDALGKVIGQVMATALGANNYAAGRNVGLYARTS